MRLLETGLNNALAGLKLEEAIAVSGVPRASAYRAWSVDREETAKATEGRRPQSLFQDAVRDELIRQAERAGHGVFDRMVDALQPIIRQASSQGFARLDPEERGALLREVFRVAGNLVYREIAASPICRLHPDVLAGTRPTTADRPVTIGLDLANGELIQRISDLIIELAALFGVRIRGGLEPRQFGYSAVALLKGVTVRPDEVRTLQPDLDPDSEDYWSLYSVGLLGLFRGRSEPQSVDRRLAASAPLDLGSFARTTIGIGSDPVPRLTLNGDGIGCGSWSV